MKIYVLLKFFYILSTIAARDLKLVMYTREYIYICTHGGVAKVYSRR